MSILKARTKSTLSALTLVVGFLGSFAIAGLSVPAQAEGQITVVVLATPSADGAEARKEYSEKVNPLGKEAGVKIIKGVKVQGALAGTPGYTAVFLLGFATEQAAKDFFSSEKYRALIPLRDAGYDQYDALIGK